MNARFWLPACPSCGSTDAVPIVYGYPMPGLVEQARRGEVRLGGCVIDNESPAYECARCGTPLPTPEPSSELLRAGVYGHLIGDALGVPYEFTHPAPGAVTWRGHGTHDQPPGTWSDDGALMLATLDSLLSARFDTDDQARRFLDWYPGGAYTPDPGQRPFDIGGTTSRALERLRAGVLADEAGDGPDGLGNGSLMRILPVVLADPTAEPWELVDRAHRASRITHGAPECLAACALYLLVAQQLIDGERDRTAAQDTAVALLREEYEDLAEHGPLRALDALLAWPDRSGGGHVLDSFWSAWDAFAASHDYRSAVVRAVEYGNDTDTTAAIAGGLAGIYWGFESIPAEWLAGLRGRDLVEEILRRRPPSAPPR